MPDLAAAPKPAAAPLAVETEIDEQPLIADAPTVDPPKRSYRVDAAHSPRAPHASRRTAPQRPASTQSTVTMQPDQSSPVQRKPLYDGAEGRRERMKAAKAPVWRTRLFLAMIAAVLVWGTIQISSGHRNKNPHPAADADEAPPFETDIQLGELGDAPGFGPTNSGLGLDQHSHGDHPQLEKMEPAATAAMDIAPPLQSTGHRESNDAFAPFATPTSEDAATYRAPQVSGRPTNPQTSSEHSHGISATDLLGGSGQRGAERVANLPNEDMNRGSYSAGAGYDTTGGGNPASGNPTQTRYGATLPAESRSDANAPWWKEEPRGAAPGSNLPAGSPRFDGAISQETPPPNAQLGTPEPISPAPAASGSRYGQQQRQAAFDPFGGTPPSGAETYYAPGDPAANRPAQARLNGNLEPTESSRWR
ncbi:hypothetical protein M4951_09310 [Blastopirellula sp. J2-11]|uniref:hypothetical protein n=1 Tax=Blastopirellula sp. J2-11 TaxID=2943192 RepID=UPI0021C8A3CA|nr:hypothetical protein [Blastopirellula sp. J2-11]UUO08500.1 hypothetical protein M4951_09310 [Blastopirellula sp. J2-11]